RKGALNDFYPKFHCELNFIEQYWVAVKLLYRSSAQMTDMDAMECNMIACLDDSPLIQFQCHANQSVRFISAYSQGLSGSMAAWANRNQRYHGHQTLPPLMAEKAKAAYA
ncbi:hypothetical protein JB92DRAFT_2772905, partial [Gautieria morchelliformis]